MRAKVVAPFFDLTTGLGNVPENTYQVGDVFEGTVDRISDLEQRGFVQKAQRARKKVTKAKKAEE